MGEVAKSSDRKPDLRVERTRQAIRTAFRKLVCESDGARITVKDLANRAGINRKTFYLHYESIEALYDEELGVIMDDFFRAAETTPDEPKDIAGHAIRFFLYLAEQPLSTERLVCNPAYYDDFGAKLYTYQMNRYKTAGDPFRWMPEGEYQLALSFIRSTALSFYRQWVRSGKTVEPNKAAELLAELTCHGIENLMK